MKTAFKNNSNKGRKTRIISKDERITFLINEVLQDIDEFGKNYEAVVFYINDKIEDYALEQGELIFPEEDMKLLKLIDLLVELYALILPTRISAIIKAHRMALDMSQEELAQKINVSQQHIALWENGKSIPSNTYLPALIKNLDIDFHCIIDLN
jgi:DNA-binding XRE family transcriptional regulator